MYDDGQADVEKISEELLVDTILKSVKENMSLKHLQDSEDQEFI